MTIIRKEPSTMPTFSNFFDDFLGKDLFSWSQLNNSQTGTTIPAVNVKESDENFQLELAAPGLKKEDFKVEINNNVLSISCEQRTEKEEKEGERYSRREFSYQAFKRAFTLPSSVDTEHIAARYEDGLLHLTLPKREEAKVKPVRTVNIS